MTEVCWDLDEKKKDNLGKPIYPDPDAIVEFLRSTPVASSLVFEKRDRVHQIFNRLRQERGTGPRETSYAGFAERYRNSLEFAWFSVCALIKSDKDVSCVFDGERFRLTVHPAAVEEIRQSVDLDVHRAAIVPEVTVSILYNFAQAMPRPFIVAIDRSELAEPRSQTVAAISTVEFVRGVRVLENGAYYRLQDDKIERYGFSSSDIARPVHYKGTVDPPTYDGETPRIPSFLCYPSFTNKDQSGMNLAIAHRESVDAAVEVGEGLSNCVWWHNHHACRQGDCQDTDCPNRHFEGSDEFRLWRDYSIAPYVRVRQLEMNSPVGQFDHSIMLSFGVEFDDKDLLGFFLSMCVVCEPGFDGRPALGEFMRNARAHAGHTRYSMLANLASEIAAAEKELSESRQRHGQMLRLLNGPINDLRRQVLNAIDDARRITQIIQGVHSALFVKAASTAEFFQEGGSARIGNKLYRIAHEPSHYHDLEAQVAVFSAILLRVFGQGWTDNESAIDLYRRAYNLLLGAGNELDRPLIELCRQLVELDPAKMIEIEISLIKQEANREMKLVRAMERLKDVLHTPAKEDSEKYPWLPLLLVLLEDGTRRDVQLEPATVPPAEFHVLLDGIEWVDKNKGVFLRNLPLPVPRYDMLLTFLADLLAFDRNERDRDPKNPLNLRRPKILIQEHKSGRHSRWTLRIPLITKIDDVDGLRESMARVAGTRGHTYAGNFRGPFLAWAAACEIDAKIDMIELEKQGLIFAVQHRGVESTMKFDGANRSIILEFGRVQ